MRRSRRDWDGCRKRKRDWFDTYEKSMALCAYLRRDDCTPEGVERYWHQLFNAILSCDGFDKCDRKYLWKYLVQGNWENLHQSAQQEEWTPEKWLEQLRGDVFYCSDRWSFDRLTRCHWMYRQYKWAI